MSKKNIFLATILLYLILVVLASVGSAQVGGGQFSSSQFPTADYCTPSLPQEMIGRTPSTNEKECRCYNFGASYSDWRELYCKEGGLIRERTVQDLLTPNCVETVVFREQQWIYDRRCRICPNPLIKGEWSDVVFLNGKWLQQRDMSAFKFTQEDVTECIQVEVVELRWSEQSVGGIKGFEEFVPIAIILVVFFVILRKVKK
jgi:hypothetical protein